MRFPKAFYSCRSRLPKRVSVHVGHCVTIFFGLINGEFQGAVLAARILPGVALKAKVADRLLKVLSRTARREGGADADTLALALVVYRSQRKVVDKAR